MSTNLELPLYSHTLTPKAHTNALLGAKPNSPTSGPVLHHPQTPHEMGIRFSYPKLSGNPYGQVICKTLRAQSTDALQGMQQVINVDQKKSGGQWGALWKATLRHDLQYRAAHLQNATPI